MWTEPVVRRIIPYGYTLGNHDGEGELTPEEVIQLDLSNPNSLTQKSPSGVSGASNFVVPIYSSSNKSVVVMNIWFFDSGDYGCYTMKNGECSQRSIAEWYREKSKELAILQGGFKKGIAFFHIPPQELMATWNVIIYVIFHFRSL